MSDINVGVGCDCEHSSRPSVTASEPTLDQISRLLSGAIDKRKHAERRLEDIEYEIDQYEIQLTEMLLNHEPTFTADGKPPVVAFTKRYNSGGYEYSFAAIGYKILGSTPRQAWSVTGDKHGGKYTWKQLVSLMGVDGLKTLEVLRGA